MIVQDPSDERHMMLRPLEETKYEEFYDKISTAMQGIDEELKAELEVWDLDLINLVAFKMNFGPEY